MGISFQKMRLFCDMFQFFVDQTSVVSHKSLFFVCHYGLDPESILSDLDSRSPMKDFKDRFHGNDDFL
jgi:hypothetical protein